MQIHFLKRDVLTPAVWQGGKTYEYFIYPISALYSNRNFDFRISSATIEQSPSLFTQFDGYSRYLVMLDNDLKILRNNETESYAMGENFSFNSNDTIESFSLGNDFNLMIRNGIEVDFKANDFIENTFSTEFIFLFALNSCFAMINTEKHECNQYDCIVIENKELENINISTNSKWISASFNIKKIDS